ncbi:CheY-like receiver protein [Oleiphilus messinensis]|uniref:CheY-like receiver protein n=1 Tax=Oleiphilus messinensis TaxID=141451 RepID=A0A1Y0IB88_9GAMM|nr:tetratricopeptide repeat protein [Oleiphilus messinensis]ARU57429.1 CheY-like receiver protein [Oleiphilus messinensis]
MTTSKAEIPKALLDGKRALVIDDMGAAVVIGKNMLLSLGSKIVETAGDYQNAFPKIAKKHYDIILCDFNLGKGLNGQQLLRDLRHINRLSYTTLFVVVSAERTHDIVLGTIECEPDGYIAKPFTQGDFKARITRLVEQQNIFKTFNEALDAKDYEAAFANARGIMSKLPKYRMLAIRKTAGILYELKRYNEALKLFDLALETHIQTWAQIGRAKCIAELGRNEDAISEFQDIISKNRLAVPAMDFLGICYLREGKRKEAQETIIRSTELSPMSIERQRWLGELSMDVGDLTTAVGANRAVIKLADGTLKENPKQYETYSRTMRKAVESETDKKKRSALIEEGRKTLKKALKKFEEAERLKLNDSLFRSLEKCEKGDTEEAIAIIEALSVRHKEVIDDDPELTIDIAESQFHAGDRPGGEARLRELMKKHPENKKLLERVQAIIDTPLPYYQRIFIAEMNRKGKSHYELDQLEDALVAFRKALEIYPQHPAINLNAVQVMLKMIDSGLRSDNALREADQYLSASVSLEPEHPEYERKEAFRRYLDKKLKTV